MNPQLQKVLEILRTKPPNIPAILFANIEKTAADYGDEYPLIGEKVEREIIKGSRNMLKNQIPPWVYSLTPQDWGEFFIEISKLPHRGTYMVWLFNQMKARLR